MDLVSIAVILAVSQIQALKICDFKNGKAKKLRELVNDGVMH